MYPYAANNEILASFFYFFSAHIMQLFAFRTLTLILYRKIGQHKNLIFQEFGQITHKIL